MLKESEKNNAFEKKLVSFFTMEVLYLHYTEDSSQKKLQYVIITKQGSRY